MSIVPLVRVTLFGSAAAKDATLRGLQGLGCLHLEPLAAPPADALDRPRDDQAARALDEAIRDLADCPRKRKPLSGDTADPQALARRVLEVRDRRRQLEDRRDFLRRRIAALAPWGEFEFPLLEELGGWRLWFYTVPLYLTDRLPPDRPWRITHRDHRHAYVVLLAAEEPTAEAMPVPRTHTGALSPSQLRHQLDRTEQDLDELQAVREGLTRHLPLLLDSQARFADAADLRTAAGGTLDAGGVYALTGWAPRGRLEDIRAFAREHTLALRTAPPGPGEAPPTLMANPERWRGGEELVRFYTTPGYRAWDPSRAVFFSFAVFFAMIVSDAGYALLLGLILALFWRRLGRGDTGRRMRRLGAALVGTAAVYGVLVGSYFGAAAPNPLLARAEILDLQDFEAMMALSIAVGGLHVTLANLAQAWLQRWRWNMLAPLGWIAGLAGGAVFYLGEERAGIALAAAGLLTVVTFAGAGRPPLKRLLAGLLGLTQITKLFGDVLSYLRLFALGLASASLALTFNDLAGQVIAAYPQTGLLMAIPILLFGHGLNFVLAMMSGVVHGLRLNFIEFFNWSLSDEGYPFRPFARRAQDAPPAEAGVADEQEVAQWTR
jgi:V/A-type H+-transporting ATPase subunit I